MPLSLKSLFVRKKLNVNPFALGSFNSKFPNAERVLWQQIDTSKWQVHFYSKKKKKSALFNSKGEWMETISPLTLDKIPLPIQYKLEEEFKKEGTLQIHYVQCPNNSLYDIKWKKGIYGINLFFDVTGKISGRILL